MYTRTTPGTPTQQRGAETTLNAIQVKALLLDTITRLKMGHGMTPNVKSVRNQVCDALGHKRTINDRELLTGIGLIYKQNRQESEFWRIIDKFGAEQYLIIG